MGTMGIRHRCGGGGGCVLLSLPPSRPPLNPVPLLPQIWTKPLGNTSHALFFRACLPHGVHIFPKFSCCTAVLSPLSPAALSRPSAPVHTHEIAVAAVSTGPVSATFSLPFANVSADFTGAGVAVCIRDLYTKQETGPLDP